MKIVHTADWHIGKLLCDYSLLEDQRYWFDHFVERLKDWQPDALVVAGDLYDRSVPSAEAVALLDDILSRIVLDLKIPTFLIAGNHDSRERLSFASGLLEKSGLYVTGTVSRDIRKVTLGDSRSGIPVNFYLLPYVEPHNVKMLYPEETVKNTGDALRLLCADMLAGLETDEINVLLGHGLFSYQEMTSALENTELSENGLDASVGGSELADITGFDAFDYCAFGHLHSARTAGCDKMRYSGSPLKYSVDEANQQKSVTIVQVEKGQLCLKQESIPPLRDVRKLQGGFQALMEESVPGNREDYIFIALTDREVVLNAIARLKTVYPNVLGLRYSNLASASAEQMSEHKQRIAQLPAPELFGNFYQTVTQEPMNSRQMEYVDSCFQASVKEKGDAGNELTDSGEAGI